jgi:hypothetical protein
MNRSRVLLIGSLLMLFFFRAICAGQDIAPKEKPPKPERDRNFYPEKIRTAEKHEAAGTATTTRTRTITLDANQSFAATSRNIRLVNPAISNGVLDHDQIIISEAVPAIKTRFIEEGFDESDVHEATWYAWIYLRVGANAIGSTIALTLDVLIDRVDDMGKIVISSDPDDAQVDITAGTQFYSDHTVAKMWLTAGPYHIRISKPGYVPVEDDCDVKKGKKTEFKRTLTAQP